MTDKDLGSGTPPLQHLTHGQRQAIETAAITLQCLKRLITPRGDSGYASYADARFDIDEQLAQLSRNFPDICPAPETLGMPSLTELGA